MSTPESQLNPQKPMSPDELVDYVGREYRIPRGLRHSLFKQESGGNPNVRTSTDGAMGMGQLMEGTAKQIGVNPRDPVENVVGSMHYLHSLYSQAKPHSTDETEAWSKAVAGYFSGPGNMGNAPGQIYRRDHADGNGVRVSHYVTGVMSKWADYHGDDNDWEQPKPVAKPALKLAPPVAPKQPDVLADGTPFNGLALPPQTTPLPEQVLPTEQPVPRLAMAQPQSAIASHVTSRVIEDDTEATPAQPVPTPQQTLAPSPQQQPRFKGGVYRVPVSTDDTQSTVRQKALEQAADEAKLTPRQKAEFISRQTRQFATQNLTGEEDFQRRKQGASIPVTIDAQSAPEVTRDLQSQPYISPQEELANQQEAMTTPAELSASDALTEQSYWQSLGFPKTPQTASEVNANPKLSRADKDALLSQADTDASGTLRFNLSQMPQFQTARHQQQEGIEGQREQDRIVQSLTPQDKQQADERLNEFLNNPSAWRGINEGLAGSAVGGSTSLAGLFRAIGNATGLKTSNEISDWLRRKAYVTQQAISEADKQSPMSLANQGAAFTAKLGADLVQIAALTHGMGAAAPSLAAHAAPAAFAAQSGLQSYGSGRSASSAGAAGLQGGATGALFGAVEGSPLATRVPLVGVGTAAIEGAGGAPLSQIGQASAMNMAFSAMPQGEAEKGAKKLGSLLPERTEADPRLAAIKETAAVNEQAQEVARRHYAPDAEWDAQSPQFHAAQDVANTAHEAYLRAQAGYHLDPSTKSKLSEEQLNYFRRWYPDIAAKYEVQPETAAQPETSAQPTEAQTAGMSDLSAPLRQRFQHRDFGLVEVADNQVGISTGKVRVVSTVDGAEHIIQRPNGRGQGNSLAVPVRGEANAANRIVEGRETSVSPVSRVGQVDAAQPQAAVESLATSSANAGAGTGVTGFEATPEERTNNGTVQPLITTRESNASDSTNIPTPSPARPLNEAVPRMPANTSAQPRGEARQSVGDADKTLTRNFRAGMNDASLTFASPEQRDLYDAGAALRYRPSGKTNQRSAKDPTPILQSVAARLGVSVDDARRMAYDVHDDVRAQMKGVGHGETRVIVDNHNLVPVTDSGGGQVEANLSNRARGTAPPPDTPITDRQTFESAIKNPFRLTDKQANHTAIIADELDNGLSKVFGVERGRLFKQIAGVERGGQATAAELNQSAPVTPEFKRWSGDTPVVEPSDSLPKSGGFVLRAYHGTPEQVYNSNHRVALQKAVRLAFEKIGKPYPGDDAVAKDLDGWSSTVRQFSQANPGVISPELHQDMRLQKPFEVFDRAKLGSNTEAKDTDIGFFFTPDREFAGRFTYKIEEDELTGRTKVIPGRSPHIYDTFIRLARPLRLYRMGKADAQALADSGVLKMPADRIRQMAASAEGSKRLQVYIAREGVDALKAAGYDSVINAIKWNGKVRMEIQVIEPTQIKSAIGNRGTFDPTDPNILNQKHNASTEFIKGGQAIIRAFETGNVSSVAHEGHHVFLPEFFKAALETERPEAQKLAKDFARWLGTTPEKFTEQHQAWVDGTLKGADKTAYVDAQERAARGFERYLKTGVAPSVRLREVFDNFKTWLTDIYGSIRGKDHPLKGTLSPEAIKTWDSLLGASKGEHGQVIHNLYAAPDEATPAFFANDSVRRAVRLEPIAQDATSAEMSRAMRETSDALTRKSERVRASQMNPEMLTRWARQNGVDAAGHNALRFARESAQAKVEQKAKPEETGIAPRFERRLQTLEKFVDENTSLVEDFYHGKITEKAFRRAAGQAGVGRGDVNSVVEHFQSKPDSALYHGGGEAGGAGEDLQGGGNIGRDGEGDVTELFQTNSKRERRAKDYIPSDDENYDFLTKRTGWTVQRKVPISDIRVDKSRMSFPNDVSESQVKTISDDFDSEQWLPVRVDEDGYLLDGQHRLKAARRMGLKYIDTVVDHDARGTAARDQSTRSPIRWVGGKRQFLPVLQRLYEPFAGRRLVEPFAGSGTVTFGLKPQESLINDANPVLANFHQRVADGLEYNLPYKANAVDFKAARERYNELLRAGQTGTVEAAKLFYYLNQTAHGGLYRVNRSGEFNVPFQADRAGKPIRSLDAYRAQYEDVNVQSGDFEDVKVRLNDFIYSDPPYDSEFSAYQKGGFGWDEQVRHAGWLAKQSVPIVTQNEATPRILEMYRDKGFDVWTIPARRSISRDVTNRAVGAASEMIAFKNMPAEQIAAALKDTGARQVLGSGNSNVLYQSAPSSIVEGAKAAVRAKVMQGEQKRLETSISDYERRIAEGDISVRRRPSRIVSDEVTALRAKRDELRGQLNALRKSMLAVKPKLPEESPPEPPPKLSLTDYALKARRAVLLSGTPTFAKLSAAASWRIIGTPVEEVVGALLPKRLSDAAPREGRPNARAEMASLKGVFSQATPSDMLSKIKTGKSSLDRAYGAEDSLDETQDNSSWLDFFGRIHGALKVPAQRSEFYRSLEKRGTAMSRQGVDITAPETQLTLGAQAYADSKRAILMNDNLATDIYKETLQSLSRRSATGRAVATAARLTLPIVKVPTNYVIEASSYLPGVGATKGLARLIKARGIDNLSPDEADAVARAFKKQGVGLGLVALGYFNPQAAGGYYTKGERDEKDVKAGEFRVFGVTVPHLLAHSPALEAIQFGATVRRLTDEGKDAPAATFEAAKGLAEEVPFVDTYLNAGRTFANDKSVRKAAGEFVKGMVVAPDIQRVAKTGIPLTNGALGDVDAQGQPAKRYSQGFTDSILTGIPGLRRTVSDTKDSSGGRSRGRAASSHSARR